METCGVIFNEKEIITADKILECFPQGIRRDLEIIGVPLRACIGIQAFYNNQTREYSGVSFYAPPYSKVSGPPHDTLKYVLACADGTVNCSGGQLILSAKDIDFIYSNFNITRSSGSVKKGQIVGTVSLSTNSLTDMQEIGYGVTLMGFKSGKVVDIASMLRNIPHL